MRVPGAVYKRNDPPVNAHLLAPSYAAKRAISKDVPVIIVSLHGTQRAIFILFLGEF
jgi:hypothetical protein